MSVYRDDFPACAETFTTFRIFSSVVSASDISRRLGLRPSRTHAVGDPVASLTKPRRNEHAWFLSSRNQIESRDTRRHLDWILDQLEPRIAELRILQAEGAQMDVMAYWVSASGEGGPVISSRQMERLAPFGVECWWDVYFADPPESESPAN